MKAAWVWLMGVGVVAGSAASLLGCNGLLGIGAASLESDDGGTGIDASRSLSCPYYCSTIVQNCTQNNAEFEGTEDPTSICMSMCPALDVGTTGIGPSNDDTLGCRIYYAEQAANDPATNCRFAGVMGGGKCGTDPCQIFCALDLQYCSNPPVSKPAYATVDECTGDCRGDAGYPYQLTGPDLLDTTNTLNCRFYHLENAYGTSANGQFHCPHTMQASSICK
jgi:hypothetical protein